MSYDIGPRIGIEGEKAFKDSLSAVVSNVKALGAEMKAVTAAFSGNEHSMEALTAQSGVLERSISATEEEIALLNKQYDSQKKVLEGLGEALEQAAAEYPALAAAAAEPFARLSEFVRSYGGAFCYAGIPEQRVYFRDRYPDYLSAHETEISAGDGAYARAMAEAGVDFLDMAAVYDAQGHPEAYYSAVDHHYRYYGAYAAYRAILEHLSAAGWNLPVLTEEELDFRELPNPYIATRNRKLYNLWPNGEGAVIGVQRDPVPFTRYDNGEPSDRPLFVLPEEEYLPTTYNLYMGGDFGETVLETDRPELPNALIFGDSFTNALETLLYASFNETRVLDLRHYGGMSLREYVETHRPDVVLCIQNDTFYYLGGGNNHVWEEP